MSEAAVYQRQTLYMSKSLTMKKTSSSAQATTVYSRKKEEEIFYR